MVGLSESDRFLFVGDVHVRHTRPTSRVDDFEASVCDALRWCVQTANRFSCPLVFGGDLGHYPKWTHDLFFRVLDILNESRTPMYTVIGNHDVIRRSHDTWPVCSLGRMVQVSPLKVIPGPFLSFGRWRLWPFHSDVAATQQLIEGKWKTREPKQPGLLDVAVAHAPVGAVEHYGQLGVQDLNIPYFDLACFADIHKGFKPWKMKSGCTAINVGALERMDKSEMRRRVQVALIDQTPDGRLIVDYLPVPVGSVEEVFNPHLWQTKPATTLAAAPEEQSVEDTHGHMFLQELEVLSKQQLDVRQLIHSVGKELKFESSVINLVLETMK